MKSTLVISALGLTLLASAASAAPQNGLYGGISYGSANYEVNDSNINPDVEDGALSAYLGQQLNNYFAAELALVSVSGITEDDVSLDAHGIEVSVLGFFPVSSTISFFGRLGYWDWDAERSGSGYTEASNTDLVYGAGVEYNPTQRLQMRLEAKKYEVDGNNENINLVNGSIGYRFY